MVDCGRPRSGNVADIIRSTRAAYHRAIRHIKRNQEDIFNDKFACALMENRNRDFWNETKRIRSSRNTSVNFVDGVCEPQDVTDIFATKYQDLYTCVSYSCSDMSQIRCDITDSVAGTGYKNHCLFSKSDIENAVKDQMQRFFIC